MACIDAPLRAVVPGGFAIAIKPVALSEIAQAWSADDPARRTVFTPAAP
jgi:hypothetical protein